LIILDENIVAAQRIQLRTWGLRFNHIGTDIGHKGMQDRTEIIPLLHRSRRPVFFTHDLGFFDSSLRHRNYAIVCLDVSDKEAAAYVRRFLRHPRFRANKQRLGKVIMARERNIRFWETGNSMRQRLGWGRN
jgi:hypothetical protein